MSKTIRVEDEVYERLEVIREKRETFSEAVGRLCTMHSGLGDLTNIMQGQKAYREFQLAKLKKEATDRG